MTSKKLFRLQVCWVKLLSGFNFVFFYTSGRENGKIDLFICQPNECQANNHNDQKPHLLSTIFPSTRRDGLHRLR